MTVIPMHRQRLNWFPLDVHPRSKKVRLTSLMLDITEVHEELLQPSDILNAAGQTNKKKVRNLLADNNALVTNGVVQQRSEAGPAWPEYTNLVRSRPGNTITLKYQEYELKLVIRKAINSIECCVRFRDVFPTLPKRNKWGHECLEKACDGFANSSSGGVKEKYMKIRKRLDIDHKYFKKILCLVRIFSFTLGCS